MTTTQSKLARIANRYTAHELVATNGARKVLAGYTVGKSRARILSMVQKHGPAWVALTGATDIQFAKKAGDGAAMGDWTIRYSGRTQRDAIIEGELPFITEVVNSC